MNDESHDIGWAVKQLWNGDKVARVGWNGKGAWISLMQPTTDTDMDAAYVYMRTASGYSVPWLCSQTDLLATDWQLA